jgi:hypothetical protein
MLARRVLPQLLRARGATHAVRAGSSRNPTANASSRAFSQALPRLATATTANSSWKDPAPDESQRHLELGTAALEAGNVANAKVRNEVVSS